MSIARIITQDPESTEALAAYLRAEGYDVVYAQPGEPQPGSGELTIVVEACIDHIQAVARARELAALRGCDVFVGEGIVERLDLESFETPEAVPEPEAPGVALEPPAPETPIAEAAPPQTAYSSAGNSAAPEAAPDSSVSDPELNRPPAHEPPAYEEAEFISGRSEATSQPQAPPPLVSRSDVSQSGPSSAELPHPDLLQANGPRQRAVRAERPAQLGFRALRAAKELLGLHLATLLEGTRNGFQRLKMRASAKLEQFLAWQQLHVAALSRRREEKRKLEGQIMAKRAQSDEKRRGGKVTPIEPSRNPARQQAIRDWKAAFTGASVAALLVLFVLGVFSSRGPATDRLSAQPPEQSRTAAFPPANAETSKFVAPAVRGAVINAEANGLPVVKPAQPGSSQVRQIASQEQMPGTMVHQTASGKTISDKTISHKIVAHSAARRRTVSEDSGSEPEVIVRHFGRPNAHPAPRTVAGVKRYSDMN